MLALIALLAFVAGLLILALIQGKAALPELGRALLWCGLLVTLLAYASKWIKVL